MEPITSVAIVGDVENVTRKSNVGRDGKDVAEFYVAGVGLRITAWDRKAADVPDSGVVAVTGYIATRTYEYEGKERTSTEIRAHGAGRERGRCRGPVLMRNPVEAWQERRDRQWWQRYHREHRWDALGRYNSERARGIVHTPEWEARMAEEQAAFEREQRA